MSCASFTTEGHSKQHNQITILKQTAISLHCDSKKHPDRFFVTTW